MSSLVPCPAAIAFPLTADLPTARPPAGRRRREPPVAPRLPPWSAPPW